jgi:hypothetical protein
MAEREKSLDQLIQLAISVYYNQDITNREKDKRYDRIVAPTRLGPTSRVCYHGGQEGHFCRECLRGDSLGDSPAPTRDPALSAKVTTGGLSASISRWKLRCHLLWIDGSQPPVHTPLLGIHVEEPRGSHNDRKVKGHFPVMTVEHISLFYLSLQVPGPMTRLLFGAYLASP